MNKTSLIAITIVILGIIASIFILGSKSNGGANSASAENSQIKDGVQYITINAGGGYSPKVSSEADTLLRFLPQKPVSRQNLS